MQPIARLDAIRTQQSRYFTGKPCRHGHLVERSIYSGRCVECLRLQRAGHRFGRYRAPPVNLHAWREWVAERDARRYSDPLHAKLAKRLRSRLSMAVHEGYKGGSAVRLLGCSVAEFKKRIELIFRPGMSWENWSRDGWHLDHIIPLVRFDLTDPAQCAQALHWTNYQPLWGLENCRKGAS